MRALVVEQLLPDYAGCVVKDVPTPEPAAGEVRIKVRAAAVNFPDLMQTRGEHQHKPTVPFVGGLELAGEVDALGPGVSGFQPGDAVVCGGRGGFAPHRYRLPALPRCRLPDPPLEPSPRPDRALGYAALLRLFGGRPDFGRAA